MEFDIINDILNSTVSNLFTNRSLHLKLLTREEEPLKADIPRSSSNRKEDFRDLILAKEPKDYNNPIIYENWKNKESKQRLEEALKRLNLEESKIKSKSLVNSPLEFLVSEKGKVKNELKKYDNEFLSLFNRVPNRAEKEVMRPIYLYYKNLKLAIDHKSKQNQAQIQQSQVQIQVNNEVLNNNTNQKAQSKQLYMYICLSSLILMSTKNIFLDSFNILKNY